jgi:hypothetical protein
MTKNRAVSNPLDNFKEHIDTIMYTNLSQLTTDLEKMKNSQSMLCKKALGGF